MLFDQGLPERNVETALGNPAVDDPQRTGHVLNRLQRNAELLANFLQVFFLRRERVAGNVARG